MPADDSVHDRQPDAGSGKFFGAVQALKNTEQLVVVLHVESGAVILDVISRWIPRLPLGPATDLDHRGMLVAGKLDCVTQQIGQRLFQEWRIGFHDTELADQKLDLPVVAILAQFADDSMHKILEL